MRRNFDGLASIVRHTLLEDPFSGHVFVVRGRRGDRIKVSWWSGDGMIESLRVLMVCRKTAVAARHVALQMIQTQIVSAPDALRDQIRTVTRIGLLAPPYYFFDRPAKTRIGTLHIG